MTNREVVNFLNACLKESEDTFGPFRKVQMECYDRYRSFRDYSKKKDWQHKIVVPSVYPAIKGASGLLKRILMKSDKFFEFTPERQDDAPQKMDPVTGQPIKDMMDNFARGFTRKVRFHMDEAEFIEKFEEGVESALAVMIGALRFSPVNVEDARIVWGPIPVVDPNTGQPVIDPATGKAVVQKHDFLKETTKRAKLKIEVVNPLLLHFPLDRSWIIEESRPQLHTLIENAEGIPWDKKELNRLVKEDFGSAARTEADNQRLLMLKIKEPKNKYRREVVLHTYWGSVTDEKGKIVVKDGYFIVANQKYLLLKPAPSPYWLRKHPYVFINPLKVLFQCIGAGMIDGIRPIINALDNIVNIMGDKALFALLAPSEVNVDALKDPQQAEGGLTPGKMFKTKGPLGQAFHQQQGGDIPQGGFSFAEFLKNSVQNYTGWTEFIQGMQGRRDVTATEVNRKTEASSLAFENIASSIEKSGVIESVEVSRDMTVQFFMDPLLNPETDDIFRQEGFDIENLPEAQKYAFLNKRYPIKVRGLSAFFDKQADRQDIIMAIEVLAKIPPLLQRLDLDEFLTRFFNTFDWPNPDQLVLDMPAAIPGAPGTVDPVTGQPIPPGIDPATGQPLPPGPGVTPGAPPGGPAVTPGVPPAAPMPGPPGEGAPMDPNVVMELLKAAGSRIHSGAVQ
jgi:hypothetical protein